MRFPSLKRLLKSLENSFEWEVGLILSIIYKLFLGTKVAQVVEADVEEAFKWLKGDNVREIRKFASILALKELLIVAPYLSFNKIFMNNESFILIWNIVRYYF